jgi:transposase
MFSYVSPDTRIPTRHPLRPIKAIVSEALAQMDRKLETLYSSTGRPSIAPERPIRPLLLQVLYTIRSERLLVEQLEYNLLFRWFVGLSVDEPVWDHSTFSKNRDRLLEADIARELFETIIEQARLTGLLSDEHFSVDGTLIQAWASHRSFRPKDDSDAPPSGAGRNAPRDYRGEQRSNDTHASTTDPDQRQTGAIEAPRVTAAVSGSIPAPTQSRPSPGQFFRVPGTGNERHRSARHLQQRAYRAPRGWPHQ